MGASELFELLASRELPIIVDDAAAAATVSELGFRAVPFDDHDFLKPSDLPALAVITQAPSIAKLHGLWEASETIFAHLALAKFDSSPRSLGYAFSRLLSVDYAATLERRAEAYDKLLSCKDIEIVTQAGVLRCHLGDELEIANCDVVMERGWLYSIAEFFEASVVNLQDERSSFWVEGDLGFDGFIDLCNSAELKARCGATLDQLRSRSTSGKNLLRFADNAIETFVVGGVDVSTTLADLTSGLERGTAATELGLGCAEFSAPEDWQVNALFHKSTRGAYVGIGKGLHIPHIDFIAKGAEIRFIGPA